MKPVALFCLFCIGFALASPAPPVKTADTKENVDLSSQSVNVPVVDSKDVQSEKQSTVNSKASESVPDSQTPTGRQGRNYPAPAPGPVPLPANDGYHMQEGFEGYLVPSTGIHYSAFANVPWVMFNVGLAALTLLLTPFLFSLLIALIPKKALLLKFLFKTINKLTGKPTLGRMMPSNHKLAGLASNVLMAVQKYQKMQTSEADS